MDGMDPTSGIPRPGGLQDPFDVGGAGNQTPSGPQIVPTAKQIPQGPGIQAGQPTLYERVPGQQVPQSYVGQGAEIAGSLRQNQQMFDHAHLMANTLNAQQQFVKGMPVIQNFGNIFMGPANNAGNMGPAAGQNLGFNIGYNGPLHPTGPVNAFPMVGSCPRPVLQSLFQPVNALPANFGMDALGLISQQLSIACGVMLQCMQNINVLSAQLGRAGMPMPTPGFQMGQLPIALPFNQVVDNIQWMSNLGQAGMAGMSAMPPIPPMVCYPQTMPVGAPVGNPFAHFYFQPMAPIGMAPNVLHGLCPQFNQMPLQQMPGWPAFAAGIGGFVPPGGFGPMQGIFQGPEIHGQPPWGGNQGNTVGPHQGNTVAPGGHQAGPMPQGPEEVPTVQQPAEPLQTQSGKQHSQAFIEFAEAFRSDDVNKIRSVLPQVIKEGQHEEMLPLLFQDVLMAGEKPEIAKCFIDAGLDVNQVMTNDSGETRTPLLSALAGLGSKSAECVKLVLDGGAQLDENNFIDVLTFVDTLNDPEKSEERCPKASIDALVNHKGQGWVEKVLKSSGKQASDFAHPGIKKLFVPTKEKVQESAQEAHQNFINSCNDANGSVEQMRDAYTALEKCWDKGKSKDNTFDLNKKYGEEGTPLELVLSNNMDAKGKVAAIRFLRSMGADNPYTSYQEFRKGLPEDKATLDQARLCWAALEAPKLDKAFFAEDADKDEHFKKWHQREHRVSKDISDSDKHFSTKREQAKRLQQQDETAHRERDQAFLRESSKTKPLLYTNKPRRNDDSSVVSSIAALPGKGHNNKSLEKLYVNQSIDVDGESYQLTGLCDPHGDNGFELAEFVKKAFPKKLGERLNRKQNDNRDGKLSEQDIREALKSTMVDVGEMADQDETLNGYTTSGIYGSFVLTQPDTDDEDEGKTKVWTANFGDCETMLIRADGRAEQLTLPTESHRGIGFSALELSKSARPSVEMIELTKDEMDKAFLVTVNGRQRAEASPRAIADLYKKEDKRITAEEFAATAVRSGGSVLVRPLSGKVDLPKKEFTEQSVKVRLDQIRNKNGRYNSSDIKALFKDINGKLEDDARTEALEQLYVALHKTESDYKGNYPSDSVKGKDTTLRGALDDLGSAIPDLLGADSLTQLEKPQGDSKLAKQVYATQQARLVSDLLADDGPDGSDWKKDGLTELHKLMKEYEPDDSDLTVEHLRDDDAAARSLIKSLQNKESRLRQCADTDPDQRKQRLDRLFPERLKELKEAIDEKGEQEKDRLEFMALYEQEIDKQLCDYKSPGGSDLAEEAGNETDYRFAFMEAYKSGLLKGTERQLDKEFEEGLSKVRELEAQKAKSEKAEPAGTSEVSAPRKRRGKPSFGQSKVSASDDKKPKSTVKVTFRPEDFTRAKKDSRSLCKKLDDFIVQGGDPSTTKVSLRGGKKSLLEAVVLTETPDNSALKYLLNRWGSADVVKPGGVEALCTAITTCHDANSNTTEHKHKDLLIKKLEDVCDALGNDPAIPSVDDDRRKAIVEVIENNKALESQRQDLLQRLKVSTPAPATPQKPLEKLVAGLAEQSADDKVLAGEVKSFLAGGGDPTETVDVGGTQESLLSVVIRHQHAQCLSEIMTVLETPKPGDEQKHLELLDTAYKLASGMQSRDADGVVAYDDPYKKMAKLFKREKTACTIEWMCTRPDFRGQHTNPEQLIKQLFTQLPKFEAGQEERFCAGVLKECCNQSDLPGFRLLVDSMKARGHALTEKQLQELKDVLPQDGTLKPEFEFYLEPLIKANHSIVELLNYITQTPPFDPGKINTHLEEGGSLFYPVNQPGIEKFAEKADFATFKAVFEHPRCRDIKNKMTIDQCNKLLDVIGDEDEPLIALSEAGQKRQLVTEHRLDLVRNEFSEQLADSDRLRRDQAQYYLEDQNKVFQVSNKQIQNLGLLDTAVAHQQFIALEEMLKKIETTVQENAATCDLGPVEVTVDKIETSLAGQGVANYQQISERIKNIKKHIPEL